MNALPSPQKIADVFQGNPQALQQRVQQGQSQPQQPGQMPSDLMDLLALNMVTEQQEAAKRQLAMQAGGGGEPPTVMQQLQQKAMANARGEAQQKVASLQQMFQSQQDAQLKGIQALAQAQAPRAGIAGVAPDVTRGMAEGGIVAFATGDLVDVPEFDADGNPLSKSERESMARRMRMEQDNATAQAKIDAARGDKVTRGPYNTPQPTPGIERLAEYYRPRNPNAVAPKQVSPDFVQPRHPASTGFMDGSGEAISQPRPAPEGVPMSGSGAAAHRLSSQGIAAGLPQVEDDMGIRKYVKGVMDANPEQERDKTLAWYAQQLGLEPMLAEREARIKAHEALKAKQDEGRDWRELSALLRSFGAADPRTGLSGAAAAGSAAYNEAADANRAADLKFNAEMMKLRDDLAEARVNGNKAKADQALKAMEQLRDQKQAGAQTGASILNTEENARTRLQVARDAAAARLQAAQFQRENRTADKEARADEAMRKQAMDLAMKAAIKAKADPMRMAKLKNLSEEEVASGMFQDIYTMLKSGKSMASTGGTTPARLKEFTVLRD